MKPGIIMTRVSTEDQNKGNSPEDQLRVCREYAANNGFEVIAVFQEDYSGYEVNRPKLNEIYKLLQQKPGCALIVRYGDRLARGAWAATTIARELAKCRAELHLAGRGGLVDYTSPEGEMFFVMEAMGNGYWGRKAKEAMVNGRKAQLRSGVPLGMGAAPYGYRKEGRKKETRYVLVEEYAAIVREIYDMFVHQGMLQSQIAANLNARGIITPMKAIGMKPPVRRFEKGPEFKPSDHWTVAMLYNILRHEVYTGTLIANKVTRNDNADKGHKTTINPESEWFRITDPDRVPAIVDRETWERAQEMINTTRNRHAFNKKFDYLMGRRLTCGCGYSMVSKSTPRRKEGHDFYYACNSKHKSYVPKCNTPYYRRDLVDGAVKKFLEDRYRNPEKLLEEFRKAQEQARRNNTGIHQQLAQIENNIKHFETMLEGLIKDQYLSSNPKTQAIFKKNIEETEQAMEEGERQRALLSKQAAATEIPDSFIELLAAYLKQEMEPPEEAIKPLHEYLGEAMELPAGVTKSDGSEVPEGTYYLIGDDYLEKIGKLAGRVKQAEEKAESFESLREKVERINLTGTLTVEDGEQVLYLHWGIDTARIRLEAYVHGSDDCVYTTGATMGACAEALRHAGAASVCGLALARSQLKP